MAEPTNRGKIRDRDANGRFLPGNKGGPGRPAASEGIKQIANASPEGLQRMLDDPATPATIKYQIYRFCLEMVYGRPRQAVDLDATASVDATVAPMTLQEMIAIARRVTDVDSG